jgi:hypothetical protein
MRGVIPQHVALFGRLHPRAYKLQRIRYKTSVGQLMPAQLVPLLTLHLATLRLQRQVMRQSRTKPAPSVAVVTM